MKYDYFFSCTDCVNLEFLCHSKHTSGFEYFSSEIGPSSVPHPPPPQIAKFAPRFGKLNIFPF